MRDSLRALLSTVQWSFIAAWTVLWTSIAMLVVALSRRPSAGLAMARRLWAPPICLVAGGRLRVSGAERLRRGEPWFLACNHQSYGDIPVLFATLPVDLRFVAKRELRRVPFLGWYMTAMGMVFIDRERRRSGAAGVEAAAEVLRRGGAILSFPTGTRRLPGEPQRFKGAAFAAALLAGAPVVPVAVHGTGVMFPVDGWTLRPGTVRVQVGEPIPTRGLPLEARDELASRTEREVERMLVRLAAEAAGEANAEIAAALEHAPGRPSAGLLRPRR
jgi:1-acyl-sn-glycerol-3-phosphate acyltransferase